MPGYRDLTRPQLVALLKDRGIYRGASKFRKPELVDRLEENDRRNAPSPPPEPEPDGDDGDADPERIPYTTLPNGDSYILPLEASGTTSNAIDIITQEEFKPGDKIKKLFYPDGREGPSYIDQGLFDFMKSQGYNKISEGPTGEDMSSVSWSSDWDVPGDKCGDVVIRYSDATFRKVGLVNGKIPAPWAKPQAIAVYILTTTVPSNLLNEDWCRNIQVVSLPHNVESIGNFAFMHCKFKSIRLPHSNITFGLGYRIFPESCTSIYVGDGRKFNFSFFYNIPKVNFGDSFFFNICFYYWYNRAAPVPGKISAVIISLFLLCAERAPGATIDTLAKLVVDMRVDVNVKFPYNGNFRLGNTFKGNFVYYLDDNTTFLEQLIKTKGVGLGPRVNNNYRTNLLKAVPALIRIGATDFEALFCASEYGNANVVEMLLENGVDVDSPNPNFLGHTPLWAASWRGQAEVVEMLLRAGADVDKATGDDGDTPLDIASGPEGGSEGHFEVVKILLAAGADPNPGNGGSPLYSASIGGHDEMVEVLLRAGANVNYAGVAGWIGATPLWAASWEGSLESVEMLLKAGADVNIARTDADGGSSLYDSIEYEDAETDTGSSPLYAASRCGHANIVRALLAAGADVNKARLGTGETSLYASSFDGDPAIVKMLIDAGADLNKATTDNGMTPLYIASARNHFEVVEMLINAGADVNKARTDDGTTPLYIASMAWDRTTIANLLRAAGGVLHSF